MLSFITDKLFPKISVSENTLDLIYNFWFDKKSRHLWFNATDTDDKLIYDIFYPLLDEMAKCLEIYDLFSNKHKIALIIYFDQFTRHFARCDVKNFNIFSAKTLNLVYSINFTDSLTVDEKKFILLPLRHSQLREHIKVAIKYSPDSNFYYHSLKDYCRYLHHASWNPTEFNAVASNCVIPQNYENNISENSKVYKTILDYIFKNKIRNVCVSFSGGVDSASILCSLILMRNKGFIDILKAVHVNYGNKEIANSDAMYCYEFCKKHSVDLYIRNISELKKSECSDRKVYEDYTQYVRFNSYKMFAPDCVVFLGHNLQDVYENILSNLIKNKKFYDLKGMSEISVKHGVEIHRPLLEISKNLINESMKTTNHTINTTSAFCERGKLRSSETSQELLESLYNIAEILKDYYSMASRVTKVTNIPNGFLFYPDLLDSINHFAITRELTRQKHFVSNKFLTEFLKSKTSKSKFMRTKFVTMTHLRDSAENVIKITFN